MASCPLGEGEEGEGGCPPTRLSGEPQGLAAVSIIVSREKRRDRMGWAGGSPRLRHPLPFLLPPRCSWLPVIARLRRSTMASGKESVGT